MQIFPATAAPTKPGRTADVARRASVVASYASGEVTVGEVEDVIASSPPYMREGKSEQLIAQQGLH